MNERSPTLGGFTLHAIETFLRNKVHTATVAVVEKYDAATQTVNVQPLIKEPVELEDGTFDIERRPVLQNVPLIFPGAGGMRITFPVRKGDTVLVVFAERSLDKWQHQGGEVDPGDRRMFHLSDAVAIPGLHPNSAPWSDADTSVITLGSDSGDGEFVATGQRVLTELNKLKNAFSTIKTLLTVLWTPVPGDGGSALKVAANTLLNSSFPPTLSAPASGTVKIKG